MDAKALQGALTADSLQSTASANAAAKVIDDTARFVAQHLSDREDIVAEINAAGKPVWEGIGSLWPAVADSLDPSPKVPSTVDEEARIALAGATAKLERNLIAGLFENQQAALPHEPLIRRTIFDVTTFTRIEDEKYYLLQAMLAELLSNLISPTGSEVSMQSADALLAKYLTGGREDDVIIRLLDSRDRRTNVATLHLLDNLTRDGSRLENLLCPAGVKWLAQLLGRLDDWVDCEDPRFELAVGIVNRFIVRDLQSRLFTALGAPDQAGLDQPDEEITPSQTTLLKQLDAYLAQRADVAGTDEEEDGDNASPPPNAFVVRLFGCLAKYTIASMKSGKDDARLPPVLIGLVLCIECLSSIVLSAQRRADAAKEARKKGQNVPTPAGGDEEIVAELKGDKFIGELVAVLQETDKFLPRVKPKAEEDTTLPFQNVKRDLVRFLGLLVYDDTRVGDIVREKGGVETVLGMCETDERNPYLREHALLTVRNLMTGNPANQAIIGKMAPVGLVGEDGELKPLPQRIKESHEKAASAANVPSSSAQAATQPASVEEVPWTNDGTEKKPEPSA